jgi:hypothetical protein
VCQLRIVGDISVVFAAHFVLNADQILDGYFNILQHISRLRKLRTLLEKSWALAHIESDKSRSCAPAATHLHFPSRNSLGAGDEQEADALGVPGFSRRVRANGGSEVVRVHAAISKESVTVTETKEYGQIHFVIHFFKVGRALSILLVKRKGNAKDRNGPWRR